MPRPGKDNIDQYFVVLDNIPPSYDENLMTEYVEVVLDLGVKFVKIIEGTALFSLEEDIKDLKVASRKVKRESLEGQTIELMPVEKRADNSVVIYDIKPNTLDETSLKKFIEQKFNGADGCVSSCTIWSEHHLGIVHLKAGFERLVEKLLKKAKHNIGYSMKIVIEPFYFNFHDIVEKKLYSLKSVQNASPSKYKGVQHSRKTDLSDSEEESESSSSSGNQRCGHGTKDEESGATGSDGMNSYSESSSDCDSEFENVRREQEDISVKEGKCVGAASITDLKDSDTSTGKASLSPSENKQIAKGSKQVYSGNNPKGEHENCVPCTVNNRDRKEEAISEAQFLLMKEQFGTFNDCTVCFKKEEKKVVIEGGMKDVDEQYWKILFGLKEIETTSLELTGSMPKIIDKQTGKTFLTTLKEMELVEFSIENNNLLLASRKLASLSAAAEKLKGILNYKEIITSTYEVPQEELDSLKEKLESQLLVEVSWKSNSEEIYIEGFKDDVLKAKNETNKLLERFNEVSGEFLVDGDVANYLRKNPSQKISSILQSVTDWNYDEGEENGTLTYKFKGQISQVKEVEDSLKSFVENIVTREIDFKNEGISDADIKLITQSCNTTDVKKKLSEFESQKKCFLKIKLPNETAFKAKGEITGKIPISDTFSVTTSSCIQIKEGDIIDEEMDVLVCVLDESINLRKTQIGKAFIRCVPELNDRFQIIQIDNPDSDVLTVPGPFSNSYTSCLAICGIVLSKWDEDTSPALLENIITKVLDEAIKLGAKSLAFPALGHGRMFKFPSDKVSQIMVDSFVSHLTSKPEIEKICIVTDEEMQSNLKLEAEKKLQKLSHNIATVENNSDTEDDMNQDMDENIVMDLEEAGDIEISITIAKTDKPNATLKSLIELIRKKCLYSADLGHEMLSVLFPVIKEKVKTQITHVKMHSDSVTNKSKITIKGLDKDVKKLETFIQSQLNAFETTLRNKVLESGNAPPRNTIEFLRYASMITEMCPSYWDFRRGPSFLQRVFGNYYPFRTQEEHTITVNVDKKTKKAITELFEQTWDPTKSGRGADARGLQANTNVEIINVERVENPLLFELYSSARKSLFEKYARMGSLCHDLGSTLPRGQIKTTEILEDFLKEQLYHEVNEHFLFHGTKIELIDSLTQRGPDPKLCTNAMLGNGVYLAETSTKSDQYTDQRESRAQKGEELKMLVMRVLLGNTYVMNRNHPRVQKGATPLKRPPCVQCESDLCSNTSHFEYDSVTLDSDPNDNRVLFREFVVYDISRCYPEYIITYKRK